MRKPTLHDVARAAGVSYATADRVLNDRGGVAAKSVDRVRRAIEDLDYRRDLHAANLSRRRTYGFRFYVPQGDHGFFTVLRQAVEAECAPRALDRIAITLHDYPALDSEALAAALDRIGPEDCDCVAVVATGTPRVAAALARLRDLGLPVVTLVGDAAPGLRRAYVGIDNAMAGRTAGRLIRLAHWGRAGRILPILGALTAQDHADRLEGARAVLAEPGAAIPLLPPIEVQDRPDLMRDLVGAALAADPGITGIYSMGAGNRALVGLLAERPGPRPFVVVHDVTPYTRPGLMQGLIDAVIDQKPVQEVASALEVMKALVDGTAIPPAARDITPAIYLRDNLSVEGG